MSSDSKDSRTVESAFPRVLEADGPSERLHLGWRILLTVLLLSAIAILGLLAASRARVVAAPLAVPAQQSSSDALVFAFYYGWFDEQTWSRDSLSDLPQTPYASRDRSAMGRHIEVAKAAGIDAFLMAWYGPDGEFNQTEANLAALLDEAARAISRSASSSRPTLLFLQVRIRCALPSGSARESHMQHPAYLRVDGRPVTFFWRPQLYGVETWQSIRNQVDPAYSGLWISEGVDTSYLSLFNGHHLYSNTWNPPADLSYTNRKFANLVADAGGLYGTHKIWTATVMPGYNDLAIRPAGFAQDREGGAYYARSWQAAIGSQPDWIVINSFNEWPEGTYIEPSNAYGDQFIGLTAHWANAFRAGTQQATPASDPVAASTESHGDRTAADGVDGPETSGRPTAYVEVSLLNVRAGPGLDHSIVTLVALGDALPLRGPSEEAPDWLQIEVGDRIGWVYAPLVRVENAQMAGTQ